MFLDFGLQCLELWEIARNDHFNEDKTYLYGYIALVVLLFVAVNLFFWYLVLKDSPGTRALIPWAFLLAAIVNLLIFIWIIYYIEAVYPEDKVYVERHRGMDDDEYAMHRYVDEEE